MALSGSTDASLNARQLVTFALEKLNVKGLGQALKPAQGEAGRVQLDLMLKDWQKHGPHLWTKRRGAGASPLLYQPATSRPCRRH